MIDKSIIERRLEAIADRIDLGKCDLEFGPVVDGFFLKTKPKTTDFCPLWISISPWVFDISAGDGFSESDISCEDFSFEEIIISILSGRSKTIAVKLFSFIPRVVLDVPLPEGANFYMVRNGIGPDRRGVNRVYDSCLMPIQSES